MFASCATLEHTIRVLEWPGRHSGSDHPAQINYHNIMIILSSRTHTHAGSREHTALHKTHTHSNIRTVAPKHFKQSHCCDVRTMCSNKVPARFAAPMSPNKFEDLKTAVPSEFQRESCTSKRFKSSRTFNCSNAIGRALERFESITDSQKRERAPKRATLNIVR